MAVTKVPFKAKYGLQSFEDSTFSKAVSVSGALSVTGNSTFTNNLTLTNGQLYQGGTAFMTIPKGTTAQRTGTPQVGAFRANTETNNFEGYIDGSWVILGGTTSLKTAAYQNMELIKTGIGHELVAGDGGLRMYRDVACFNSNTGSITGSMVFLLPAGAELAPTMYRFKVTGYDYSSGSPWELEVGAYWYQPTQSFQNARAVVKGSAASITSVRMAVDTASGRLALVLGTSGSAWSYPKVVITNFMPGYTGVAARDWSAGWDSRMDASDSALSKILVMPVEVAYTSSNFDPTLYFAKVGGAISGAVTMGSTLYVTGGSTLVGQLSLPNGAYATAAFQAAPVGASAGFVAGGTPSQGAFQCQVANTGGSYVAWNTSRIAALQVDAPSATSAYMIARATQWGVRHLGAIEMYAGGTTSSTCTITFHVQSTNNAFTFDGGGNFTAVGNVTAYSDRRLKKDLERIENALDKIDQLTGYTYVRTDIQVEHEVRQTGLIAQDVQKVLPEAVTVSDNEMQTLGVSYGNMMGLVVEAIKELRAELNELKRGV